MIASNVELTTFALSPSTAAIALTMSGSMPITVCPSGAMNSLGAYSASLATTNVPLALIAGGTCAAIVALTLGVGGAAGAVELVAVVFLPPPHPASAARAKAALHVSATSLRIEVSSQTVGVARRIRPP